MQASDEEKLAQMPQSMYSGPQLRLPGGSGGGAAGTSQLSSAYPSRSHQMQDQLSDSSSSEDKDEHSGQGGDGTGKHKGSSKRTPKQQLQNKQAQQRYRQRRKQKLAEMEQALELLNHKVQDMQQLQSQNYYLGGRAAKLEQALKSKEAEIAKLRQLISQQHVLSMGSRPGAAPVMDPELMKKNFVDSVERLKEFVGLCDLRNADTTGANVPEEVIVQCKSLVQVASAQCMEAMSPDNPAVLDIISRDPARLSPRETNSDRSRWLQVVEALRLTEDQVELILQVRREQLKKLKGIYSERLLLHTRAVEALLPGGSHDALTRQLQHLHLNGFLYTVKDLVHVSASLESLKENLRAEIQSLQDFSYMVTLNILSPIQAALLFVDAFPFHCDTLALANALAITRGDTQSTSPLAAPLPGGPHNPNMAPMAADAPPGVLPTASSNLLPLDPLALLAGGSGASPHHHHHGGAGHRPPRLSLQMSQHSPTISAMDTTSPTGGMGKVMGGLMRYGSMGGMGGHRVVHSSDRHMGGPSQR